MERRVAAAASRWRLRRAAGEPAERLRRAIAAARRPAPAEPTLAAIEAKRAELLRCDAPLIDGRFASAGPYDGEKTVAAVCAVSKSAAQGRLLHALARAFAPACAIELGTNVGVSTAYLAIALPPGGRLTTLDASPYRQDVARRWHAALSIPGVDYVRGVFGEVLAPTLAALPPVDFAFIDGHHECAPTLDYFARCRARAAAEALFVFDDIRWSRGMRRAWREIRAHPAVAVAADLGEMGVCVVAGDAAPAAGGPHGGAGIG